MGFPTGRPTVDIFVLPHVVISGPLSLFWLLYGVPGPRIASFNVRLSFPTRYYFLGNILGYDFWRNREREFSNSCKKKLIESKRDAAASSREEQR